MNIRPYYKWIFAFLLCCSGFVTGAVLSPSIPFLHTEPISVASTQVAHPSSTIIIVTSSSSYTDPTSVIALLGVLVAAISLGLVIKYVRDTAAMAKATRDSANATRDAARAAENTLQEMRNTRDEENSPFVVVYFHYIHSRHQSLYLVIENVGKSIATDIHLNFEPNLQVSRFYKDDIETNTLLKDGIKSLVPNYKIYIPFDHLVQYLHGKFPLIYKVTVSYQGRETLPQQVLEYSLDLNHFKHMSFITETGLGEIDQTLQRIADNFSPSHDERIDTTNNALGQIASSLRGGIIIKNDVSVRLQNEDILALLNEFVLLWVVGYGKQAEKWNRTFISDLRAKYSLIGDKLLKKSIDINAPELTIALHQVINRILALASIKANLDGVDGVFSSFQVAMNGCSQQDFDSLGDNIVTDVRSLIELIEKSKVDPLSKNYEQDAHQLNAVEDNN